MADIPEDLSDLAKMAEGQGGSRAEELERDAENRKAIKEKARRLGRLISQTAEYGYMMRAQKEISDDREATEALNRLQELQDELVSSVEKGEEPDDELLEERQELAQKLQRNSRYQSLVAAQSNFDKLMNKVNQAIAQGMKKGEESRIIVPS